MKNRPNRNPRYAPDRLEARLSPSAIVGLATVTSGPCDPGAIYPGDIAEFRGSAPYAGTPGGTDPAPPDGSGDPPVGDPIIPIGPAGPA